MDKTDSGHYKFVAKGHVILEEGQVNTRAYMVKKGTVRLYKQINNRKVAIAKILPGQIFGEMPLLTGEPFYATAEAADQCQLIPFDRNLIQSLLLKSPGPIQRLMRSLMEQLATLYDMVQAQVTDDIFLSICKILDLLCTHAPEGSGAVPQKAVQFSTRYSEFVAAVKDLLVVSQLEIDQILEKLRQADLVLIRDIDAVPQAKLPELARDRLLVLTDRQNFLSVARTLRREMLVQEEYPHTQGLACMDIHDFARAARTDPETVYRLLAREKIPEGLFFFPRRETTQWLESLKADFFTVVSDPKTYDELKTIDDVACVEQANLQQALQQTEQKELTALFAAAGERARKIILANVSEEVAGALVKESAGIRIVYKTLLQYEKDFFALLRRITRQNAVKNPPGAA